MKVSIIVEQQYTEPVCEIHTAQVTPQIQEIVDAISSGGICGSFTDNKKSFLLSAWHGDFVSLLKPSQIMRIYSGNKKTYAETEEATYEIKQRMYEVEEIFTEYGLKDFIRISNTDIVNFEFVKNLDMSLSGTICVNFKNKTRTFVSRRYVSVIKEKLGIK